MKPVEHKVASPDATKRKLVALKKHAKILCEDMSGIGESYRLKQSKARRLAYCRESGDARAYGRHPQTDLVGGHRVVPIKI